LFAKPSLFARCRVLQADDAITPRSSTTAMLEIRWTSISPEPPEGHPRAQYFRGIAHRMSHLALPFLLRDPAIGRWMPSVVRQDLIDRLLLESRGNEKTHQVGNHQRHDDCIISRDFEDHHYGRHGARTIRQMPCPSQRARKRRAVPT